MIGIYVQNHDGLNRECYIWIRFDKKHLAKRGLDQPYWRTPWFLKLAPWRRVLRTTRTDMESATFEMLEATAVIYLQHPCEAWKGAKHSPETDIPRNSKKMNLIWQVAHKTIPAQSDALKQLPRAKIILMYMSIMMRKQLWIWVVPIMTKIKKYEICISRIIFRDYWTLADLIRIQCPVHQ